MVLDESVKWEFARGVCYTFCAEEVEGHTVDEQVAKRSVGLGARVVVCIWGGQNHRLTYPCPLTRSTHLWLNMEVKSVWTLPSSSPAAETVKWSIMKRVHWRELDAQVQAPNTCCCY